MMMLYKLFNRSAKDQGKFPLGYYFFFFLTWSRYWLNPLAKQQSFHKPRFEPVDIISREMVGLMISFWSLAQIFFFFWQAFFHLNLLCDFFLSKYPVLNLSLNSTEKNTPGIHG
jgi:hypothetical protein